MQRETKITYYPNGKKRIEIPLLNGKIDGIKRSWYEDGTKDYEIHYKNDEIFGNSISWYEDGSLAYQINRKNFLEEGLKTYCHKTIDCIFIKGNKISAKQYTMKKGEVQGVHLTFFC